MPDETDISAVLGRVAATRGPDRVATKTGAGAEQSDTILVWEDRLDFKSAPAPRQDMVTAFLASPEEGLPYSVQSSYAEPGGGIPPHIHPVYAEGVYVIAGQVRAFIGEETLDVGPGFWFLGKAGARIGWKNIGQERAHVLAIFSPPMTEPDQVWLDQ